jgi:pyrroline-5-carboxylate reductase
MENIAFIGGGNLATAIIGGLRRNGHPGASIMVVEPGQAQRASLVEQFGVQAAGSATAELSNAAVVVWAVKPQVFKVAATPVALHVRDALHLSVMAGIRTQSIADAMGTQNVVRAMPNTPALIGQGIAGLYARDGVTDDNKATIDAIMSSTGERLWVQHEDDLDAVTALSGSGPAYVFYVIEAMVRAAGDMGLSPEQGRRLALATFQGATALALQSSEDVSTLRERVTSKGGTTYAALSSMQADDVDTHIVKAIRAAQQRARELGDEFGA